MTEKLTKQLLYLCWRMYNASENLAILAFSLSFKIVLRVKIEIEV